MAILNPAGVRSLFVSAARTGLLTAVVAGALGADAVFCGALGLLAGLTFLVGARAALDGVRASAVPAVMTQLPDNGVRVECWPDKREGS